MLVQKIEELEKENFKGYFENLEQRMHKFLDDDTIKQTGNIIKTREDAFISAKIFQSRKYYFKALLANLNEVNSLAQGSFSSLIGPFSIKLYLIKLECASRFEKKSSKFNRSNNRESQKRSNIIEKSLLSGSTRPQIQDSKNK
jgi:hypothetical protein